MPEFRIDQLLNEADLATVLQALHERRNRLIGIASRGEVNPSAEPTLRSRVADCTRMIRRLAKAQVAVLR